LVCYPTTSPVTAQFEKKLVSSKKYIRCVQKIVCAKLYRYTMHVNYVTLVYMPFILLVIGIIAALGLGGFVWNKRAEEIAVQTPVAITEPVTVTPIAAEPATKPTPTPTATTAAPETIAPAPAATTKYKDATYSVAVAYNAPDRLSHPTTVTLTLVNDVVTASDVAFGNEATGATADFQEKFIAVYKSQVIGKSLDSIKLSRVGGASLTTNAWNAAQAQIVTQAKS
jgi:hypothetical protein